MDSVAYQADQARSVLPAGQPHLRASRDQEDSLSASRQGPGVARKGKTLVGSLLPFPHQAQMPTRYGRVREPETAERRRRLRDRACKLVLDATQAGDRFGAPGGAWSQASVKEAAAQPWRPAERMHDGA